jgi:hypothetical protein
MAKRLVISLSMDVSSLSADEIAAIACDLQEKLKPIRKNLGLKYDGDHIDKGIDYSVYDDRPANPWVQRNEEE